MRSLIVYGILAMALVSTAGAGLAVDMPIAAGANIAATPDISIDGMVTTADDFTGYGVRGQLKVNDTFAGYASVGVPEDGLGFGLGGIMALPFDLPVDTAVRAGVGYWSDDSGGVDASATDINAALVASGGLDNVLDGLGWFLSLGVHYVMYEVEYEGLMVAKISADLDLPDDTVIEDLIPDDLDLDGILDLIPDGGSDGTGSGSGGGLTMGTIKEDDSDTILHVGLGLIYDITDAIGVFAGVDIMSGDYVDETFIGGGVRIGLGGGAAAM